ncbi:MAG: choice-of-anchor L domain-containing protein [Phycisphaerae bacterium]|nr:choice-of-anchor L domain-containing protein [Phycisphaerae bacterium]
MRPAGAASRALSTQDLSSGLTPADLVTALLGTGVTVSNVTFTGANVAAGTFAGGTGILSFDSGIILGSGSIAFVPGPNTQDDVSGVNAGIGDADLTALIPGYTTFDACVLEFDFVCTGTQVIQFQYVFTSEEYNEWVNSPFNDVFGFFLNGVNIALIPGSAGTPVSINNVHCENPYNPPLGSFCNLFINNDCSDIPPGMFPCAGVRDIQMDGLIVTLTATGTLNPGVNHIKLAIADAGDQVLDSNVFLRGQSFVCGAPTGACCDTVANTCIDNVPQANCQGTNEVWTVGLACDQLNPPCTGGPNPDGTDCTNPIPITTLPYSDTNTTIDKGNEYANTCLGDFDNGLDILYALTITETQCVDITVTGATPADNWIGVALDSTCPPGTVCIAQGTSQGNVATITGLTLAPGTYYLMIDRWPLASNSLSFTLSITGCGGAPTGACCNTLTQVCTDNVLEANCQGPGESWTVGVECGQLIPPCSPEIDTSGMDCEFPLFVTSLPFEDVNTTGDKQEDWASSCLGVYDDGDDIFYQITLKSEHCVDITVAGATPIDHSIGVALDDTCPPDLSCIAQASTPGTVATITNLLLAPGTYYLMIDRQPDPEGFAILNFRLTIADCPAPSGACCLHDGACAQLTEADCMSANGLAWTIDTPCAPNLCPYAKGDTNCSHSVDAADIPTFIEALIGGYTGCDITLADMNDDGSEDGLDIQAFVNMILPP